MYCPKCGQQQLSEDLRFCSRCGLAIAGLAVWVAGGGGMAAYDATAPSMGAGSPSRKGFTRGAKLMFLSAVLTPFCFGLSLIVDEPIPLLLPFTIFIAGLSVLLYARIFGETKPAITPAFQQPGIGATFGNTALPPASNAQMNNIGVPQVRTSELVQPASVTEHTTKLLDH